MMEVYVVFENCLHIKKNPSAMNSYLTKMHSYLTVPQGRNYGCVFRRSQSDSDWRLLGTVGTGSIAWSLIYIYGAWMLPRHILCCELLQSWNFQTAITQSFLMSKFRKKSVDIENYFASSKLQKYFKKNLGRFFKKYLKIGDF